MSSPEDGRTDDPREFQTEMVRVETNARGGELHCSSDWELDFMEGTERERLNHVRRAGTESMVAELRKRTISTWRPQRVAPSEMKPLFLARLVKLNDPTMRKREVISEVCRCLGRRRGVAGLLQRLITPAAGRGARPELDADLLKTLNEAMKLECPEQPRARGQKTTRERLADLTCCSEEIIKRRLGQRKRRAR